MISESYAREISVAAPPGKAYRALTKEVDRWWTTDAEGDASTVGDEATFRFGETYNTMRVRELEPNQGVVWECVAQNHASDQLSVHDEWVGTRLRWEIEAIGSGIQITFVHEGLVPEMECYGICGAGWDRFFLGSLKKYLETGIGEPYRE